MNTKIIAICNQKGGTGKTTTAVNLSTALALQEKKVLLVDMDPQGNATSGVGIDKTQIRKSTYSVLIEENAIAEATVTRFNNEMSSLDNKLFVLPSNVDLIGAEIELVAVLGREYKLKKSLISFKSQFDFVFIDAPPSLGLLTVNALACADSVLIPVQCEYYALEGLTQLMNTINLIRENLNPSLQLEGVLLTMADYRTNLTQQVISEVRAYFKEQAFQTVITRNIRLTEAPSYGKPILFYDNDSIGAKKYRELAEEILQRNGALSDRSGTVPPRRDCPAAEAAQNNRIKAIQENAIYQQEITKQ